MSDPQPIQTPKGQTYGTAKEQRQAQQVVPVAGQPSPPTPAAGGGGGLAGLEPGQVPSLQDPSALPEQPVQAGLPTGPGPGLSAMQGASLDRDLTVLKMIYQQYPMDELANLIEWSEAQLGVNQIPPPGHATAVIPNPPVPPLISEDQPDFIQEEEGDPTGLPVGSDVEAQKLAEQMTQGIEPPPSDMPF